MDLTKIKYFKTINNCNRYVTYANGNVYEYYRLVVLAIGMKRRTEKKKPSG